MTDRLDFFRVRVVEDEGEDVKREDEPSAEIPDTGRPVHREGLLFAPFLQCFVKTNGGGAFEALRQARLLRLLGFRERQSKLLKDVGVMNIAARIRVAAAY